jgi:type II secretory pathway component PulF
MNPWVLAAAMLPPVLACLMAFQVVPQFADVFRNFGAELPWLTWFLVRYTWFVVVWPLIVVAVALAWHGDARRTVNMVAISGIGSFVLFATVMAAMYLPIFKLSATI